MPIETMIGWVAAPILTAIIGALAGTLKASAKREKDKDERRDEEHRALMAGMREIMREQLFEMHRMYVVDSQPMPYDEKERADSVYRVYHSLGGNGTGTHVYEELMAAFVGTIGGKNA